MMKNRKVRMWVILVSLFLILTGCHADLDVQLFAKIAKVDDDTGTHFFPTLQSAINYIVDNRGSGGASRDVSGDVPVERTAVLLKDVRRNAGSLKVDGYNNLMCVDLNGHEYFYSDSAGTFMNVLDNSDVRVKNGKLIISENNRSLQPVFIVGSDANSRTEVRLSDLVVDDRRRCEKVDELNGSFYLNTADLRGESKLIIDGASEMGNSFSAGKNAKIEINSGKIDIFRLTEPEGSCSFTITGGRIKHTHNVDARVKEAAVGHESSITEIFEHVVSDFKYVKTGSDTVEQRCKHALALGVNSRCAVDGEKAVIRIKANPPVYTFKDAPYDDVTYFDYSSGWLGMRPQPIYITDYSLRGNNKDVGVAYVYGRFYDEDDRTKTMTEIETSFVIGDTNGGYAGFEVIPPTFITGADGRLDSLVAGSVTTDPDEPVLKFTKTNDVEITGWSWVVDGVVVKSSSDSGVDPADPNSGDPVSYYRTVETEENYDRTFICNVSSLGGQAAYGLKMIIPRGEIVYNASEHKLSFAQSNASSAVNITNYAWTLTKGTDVYSAETTSSVLDMTTVSVPSALVSGDYTVSLKCTLHSATSNSYRTFTLVQTIHYDAPGS